jgi:hypothetical protein
VIVSSNRAGEILGHPKIACESDQAAENDRLEYRIAVMEALQRCIPMPFTETMAVAGRRSPSGSAIGNFHPNPQRREHG